jgi:hypothetical protein
VSMNVCECVCECVCVCVYVCYCVGEGVGCVVCMAAGDDSGSHK